MQRLFRFTKRLISDTQPVRTEIFVTHEAETFRIELRRSAQARRYTLRLRPSKQDLVLTMPQRGSVRTAQDFADRHRGWIVEKMQRLPQNIPFIAGSAVPLRGEVHHIVHGKEKRGLVRPIRPESGPELHVFGEAAHIPRRVSDFFRREARKDLAAAVAKHSAALKLPVRSISLKDTRSRWGSCSSRGALNFSWRLIFAPPHVLDYLAAHEVAHLKHMDHSDAFWAVTRQLCPDMDVAERWLKQHGAGLHRYGKD
eukprot:gene2543-2582_t